MTRYIDEELLMKKMTRLRGCSCYCSDGLIDEIEDIMSDLPTADVIPISDNATNGDMIKAMFPSVEVKEKNNGYEVYFGIGTASQYFNHQWWNALYEGGEDRMSKETTCKNCIYANECIMYEPKMKRCKDFKESENKE